MESNDGPAALLEEDESELPNQLAEDLFEARASSALWGEERLRTARVH